MKFIKLTREAPTNYPVDVNPQKIAYFEPSANGGSHIALNSSAGDRLASFYVAENNQQIIEQMKMSDSV